MDRIDFISDQEQIYVLLLKMMEVIFSAHDTQDQESFQFDSSGLLMRYMVSERWYIS